MAIIKTTLKIEKKADTKRKKVVGVRMFKAEKARKLKRLPGLRVMNALGMVAWRETEYSYAQQYVRLLHPLSWVWIVLATLSAVITYGVPKTVSEMKSVLKSETVLW